MTCCCAQRTATPHSRTTRRSPGRLSPACLGPTSSCPWPRCTTGSPRERILDCRGTEHASRDPRDHGRPPPLHRAPVPLALPMNAASARLTPPKPRAGPRWLMDLIPGMHRILYVNIVLPCPSSPSTAGRTPVTSCSSTSPGSTWPTCCPAASADSSPGSGSSNAPKRGALERARPVRLADITRIGVGDPPTARWREVPQGRYVHGLPDRRGGLCRLRRHRRGGGGTQDVGPEPRVQSIAPSPRHATLALSPFPFETASTASHCPGSLLAPARSRWSGIPSADCHRDARRCGHRSARRRARAPRAIGSSAHWGTHRRSWGARFPA